MIRYGAASVLKWFCGEMGVQAQTNKIFSKINLNDFELSDGNGNICPSLLCSGIELRNMWVTRKQYSSCYTASRAFNIKHNTIFL